MPTPNISAVLDLRTVFPSDISMKPLLFAKIISSLVKPPSGPIIKEIFLLGSNISWFILFLLF